MWLWCYVVGCEGMWCDAMWLCDVVNWEMMCCELRRTHDSKTIERPIPMHRETLGCKTQKQTTEGSCHCLKNIIRYYSVTTTFMFGSRNTWNVQSIARSNHGMQNAMEFMFGSRNTWNIQPIAWTNQWNAKQWNWNYNIQALVVVTHETSSLLRGATYRMKNALELRLRHPRLIGVHMKPPVYCAD